MHAIANTHANTELMKRYIQGMDMLPNRMNPQPSKEEELIYATTPLNCGNV